MTQASDYRVPMLLALSLVTGLVDAVSVLGFDHAFVANMTGNVVFLGFAAVDAPGFHPLPLATAIAAFVAGAAAGGRLARLHVGSSERRWLLTVGAVEAGLLLVAAAATLLATGSPLPVLTPMALAMGLRNATVRRLGVADLTTTVLTLTLTAVGTESRMAGGASASLVRRMLGVASIALGAALGAFMLLAAGPAIPLLAAAVLTLVAAATSLLHPESRRSVNP